MPEVDVINSYLDIAALQAQQDQFIQMIQLAISNIQKLNDTIKNSTGFTELANNTKQLSTAQTELEKQTKALQTTTEKLQFTRSTEGQEMIKQQQANKANIAEKQNEIKANNELIGSYDRLQAKYKEAAKAALDAGGANKGLNKTAADLRKELDTMREKIGDHTQFVGWYEKAWNGVKSGLLNILAPIASVYGAIELGKGIINASRGVADQFEQTWTGLKFAYDAFLRSIATGDWSNLFKNLNEAITLGNQYAETQQKISRMREADIVLNAKAEAEYKSLWDKFNSADLFNSKERIKAGNEAIVIREGELREAQKIANIDKENEEKKLSFETKLSNASLERYILDYRNNEKMIDQATQYNKLKEELNLLESAPVTGEFADTQEKRIDAIKSQMSLFPGISKAYAVEIDLMNKADKESINSFIKSWAEKYKAESGFYDETRRLHKQVASLEHQDNQKDIKDYEDAIKHKAEVQTQLEALLQKTHAGGLMEEYARELETTEKSEAYKSATVEQQEQIRLGNRKKYSDQVDKLLAESITKIQKAELGEVKYEEDLAQTGLDNFVAGVTKLEKIDSTYIDEKNKLADKDIEESDERDKKALEEKKKRAQEAARSLQSSISTIGNDIMKIDDAGLKNFETDVDQRKKALENQLKSGMLSQQAYNSASTELDNELTAKKKANARERAEIELASSIVAAFGNEASAISKAIVIAGDDPTSEGVITYIINLAAAVAAAIAPFASVWSAIDSAKAVGFEKGREGGPAMWATVHPGEIIENKGKMAFTPEHPVITYLPAGASVIPAPDVRKMTMAGILTGSYISSVSYGNEELKQEVRQLQKGFLYLGGVIENKAELTLNITERGLTKTVKRGNNIYEYISRNVKL